MKRTPIIIAGQVYLHPEQNEYLVVTKANRGDIRFKGPGFSGVHDVELFLERFGPVDPADLTEAEQALLLGLLGDGTKLSVGWVEPDDAENDEEE
jgi:hypothetical protein